MKPVAKAEEDRQPLIDRGDFFTRKFAEHAPYPTLVNRSQVVDQREGPLCDDRECYTPETVPVEWRFQFQGMERDRVPTDLQRKAR
jgi:hypothetical protein